MYTFAIAFKTLSLPFLLFIYFIIAKMTPIVIPIHAATNAMISVFPRPCRYIFQRSCIKKALENLSQRDNDKSIVCPFQETTVREELSLTVIFIILIIFRLFCYFEHRLCGKLVHKNSVDTTCFKILRAHTVCTGLPSWKRQPLQRLFQLRRFRFRLHMYNLRLSLQRRL